MTGFKAALVLGVVLSAAGCTASKTLDISKTVPRAEASSVRTASLEDRLSPLTKVNKPAEAQNRNSKTTSRDVSAFAPKTQALKVIRSNFGGSSARCRHLISSAELESTLLLSPNLAVESDHEGKLGVTLGYDVVDVRRSALKQELAQAQCRRQAAASRISQLLITSPQALSRAGYLAKANVLKRSRGRFASIRGRINRGLNDGSLTYQRATSLRQYLDQVTIGESQARGEASRRQVVDGIQLQSLSGLDQELIEAERQVHRIQSELRRINTINLNVSSGYNKDLDAENLNNNSTDDVYAKLKLSVRLGVFNPKRGELEDEMLRAREDGLFETNSGIFWKAGAISRANGRALKSMRAQRKQLLSAYAEAKRNTIVRSESFEPELLLAQMRAKIDVIAFSADLAGLDATISDTLRIDRKLKFGR